MPSATTSRQSNFELLRILSMLMVLVLHADFVALKCPSAAFITAHPLNAVARDFFEAAAVVCIDCFVLISGWFGISQKLRGFCGLIFQVLFFTLGTYAISCAIGHVEFSLDGLTGPILRPNWFVSSYIVLYIFAPVLNPFLRESSLRKLWLAVCLMLAVEMLWGFAFDVYYRNGYSPLALITIYCLGHALSRSRHYLLQASPWQWAFVYLLTAMATTLLLLIYPEESERWIAYCSPLVIAGAVALLLCFAGIRMPSVRFINWVGASCFGVFLIHMCAPHIDWFYIFTCRDIYNTYSGAAYFGVILAFMFAVYAAGILVDQIRLLIWNAVWPKRKNPSAKAVNS